MSRGLFIISGMVAARWPLWYLVGSFVPGGGGSWTGPNSSNTMATSLALLDWLSRYSASVSLSI